MAAAADSDGRRPARVARESSRTAPPPARADFYPAAFPNPPQGGFLTKRAAYIL